MTIHQTNHREAGESLWGLRSYLLRFVAVVTASRRGREALIREQASSPTPSVDKMITPRGAISPSPQPTSETTPKDSPAGKTQHRTSKSHTPGDPSQSTAVPAIADSEVKAASSPWIEKYEMGTGKNKINVRIFKEPTAAPVPATEKDAHPKQVNPDTLALRLKRISHRILV